jgi:hypothetical protein
MAGIASQVIVKMGGVKAVARRGWSITGTLRTDLGMDTASFMTEMETGAMAGIKTSAA